MFVVLHALGMFVADLFKSRSRLEVENLFLRHQLNIALRRAPSHLRLRGSDRALLIWLTRLWPGLLGMAQVVQPETILRWHRTGFKAFWRWKSRIRAGRPKIDRGLRDLIQRMSRDNPLWGAARIHGELLMLGFKVAQSTVSKYMVRGGPPPSQSWKTFLQNHSEAIAAIDMCVVPTVTFDLLFAFLVVGHGRRQLLWFEVTPHPTAEWLARQITEAFPWTSAPAYLVRDNDGAYGHVFTSRLRAIGMLAITTASEHIGHWTKMRRSRARFSGLESSVHTQSLAGFITIMCGFKFLVHTGVAILPGVSELMLILWRPSSTANALVRLTRPPFEAQ
jgi:hypothetical protein